MSPGMQMKIIRKDVQAVMMLFSDSLTELAV